ncbi:hypothetical protein IFM89_004684, partial [Coptis chinensis]
MPPRPLFNQGMRSYDRHSGPFAPVDYSSIYEQKAKGSKMGMGGKFGSVLQRSAEYLGSLLGVDQSAVNIFTEEIIRAGSVASLSSLVNRLDHVGGHQPVEAVGYVVVVDEPLSFVENKSYEKPTVLVARSVRGEEEILDGAVAILAFDMPDVLSHVYVRARNSKFRLFPWQVCFATCFDPNILNDLMEKEGKLAQLKPTSTNIVY